MTNRSIYYPAAQPRSADVLQDAKNSYEGDGNLALALAGTYQGLPTVSMKGLAATATNPPSMNVNIAPGMIFTAGIIDSTAYSSLGPDTTHSTVKIGINRDITNITFTAPSTPGTSQIFLIQGQLVTQDAGLAVLQYFDTENPGQVYNGPNNTGLSQPTQRQDICLITVVNGVPGASPVAPTVSTGCTAFYLVTIPYGAVAITQSMISRYPNAHFLDLSLVDLQTAIQNVSTSGGTVTSITAGYGLNGGVITTSGIISLQNTPVTPGTYTNCNLTVDQAGRVISISNGAAGAGTVTGVTAGGGLTGGTITSTGTISMQQSTAAGTYTNMNATVDAYGRIISASNGTAGTTGGATEAEIQNLQSEINTINGEITAIQNVDNTQNNSITSLQNSVNTLNTEYSTLNTEVNTLNTEYNSLTTSITTINNTLNGAKVRYRLAATLNIYVNGSTGNDATATAAIVSSGATPVPSSTPFKTLQAAWNTIINAYDVSGQTINFNVANGTYAAGIIANGITGLTNTGSVNVIGNAASPSSCIISVSQSVCFSFATNIVVNLNGFQLAATANSSDPTTGIALAASNATIAFQNIVFGACDNAHIRSYQAGGIHAQPGTTYTVAGSSPIHVDLQPGGQFASVQATALFNAGVTCSTAVYNCKNGNMQTYQTQYSNTQSHVTGPRYFVFANGILDNGGVNPDTGPASGNGQILPGSATGTVLSGGQII